MASQCGGDGESSAFPNLFVATTFNLQLLIFLLHNWFVGSKNSCGTERKSIMNTPFFSVAIYKGSHMCGT